MNDEKLLNLAGGKILYKDLRDRIEETAEEFHEATADVLRHSSQDLTEEQKEQARTNIDAVSVEQMDVELNDLWDETDSINNILTKYNCVELYNPRPATYEDQGITFTWTDKNTCIVTGTPTATAIDLYLYVENPLLGNSLDRDRFLHFKSTGDKTQVRLEYFTTDELIDEQIAKEDTVFTIPENCMRLKVPLEVPGGSGEVNETIEIGIFSAPSNMELWNEAVKDVQVAGSSVVGSDGVANIPIATSSILGVVKSNPDGGIAVGSNGALRTDAATVSHIKAQSNTYKPIAPANEYAAAFYGMATAAGDTTQKSSNNAVGTYTEEAKAAIQQMLGVSDLIAPAENDLVASQAYAIGDVFTANGKLYKVTTAIAADGAIVLQNEGETVSGANAVQCKLGEETIKDVQINGTSILQDGVANVPKGTTSELGVLRGWRSGGIDILSDGRIAIYNAGSASIKNADSAYLPITTNKQHEATFYGLAKAAGDTTQASSANAVGAYTDSAKAAIQHMLGTDTNLADYEYDTTADAAYAIGELFMLNGKLHQATAAIAIGDTLTVGTNCSVVNAADVFPHDVQINGVSVVNNGVANLPELSNTTYGVGKTSTTYGTTNSSGQIRIYAATSDQSKAGTDNYRPVVPSIQHAAAFYGLAKAAGDTTQSASSNAVGTYTDDAKASIKRMLGITQTLTITAQTQDGVTVTGQTVTVRTDDAAGEVYATAAYEGQPVSFSLPTGFQYYVSVSDTLSHHFNPTTARGVIKDTNVAVTLTYSDFSTIKTAPDIKAALNAGMDLTDLIGEQITCTKSGETLTWDVVNYNATNKCVTLLLHDCFGTANMVFEPAQALMWCENGLVAGSYTFTWNTTQCYFTLTTAIPAGGQLRANTTNFWTYESQDATATLETGTVGTEAIAGATDLGHEGQGLLNHRDRVSYGSNNYAESALYWWLNSDAPANTKRTPVTKFSRAHSYAQPGFLNGLDSNFIAVLDDKVWLCACNNVYECPQELGGYTRGTGQTYTVIAKVGLASEMEIFGSYGGNQDGSTIFDLYDGATADDRKKYRGTAAQHWWLRSPYWGNATSERYVYSSGTASSYYASLSYGCVPAVSISADI